MPSESWIASHPLVRIARKRARDFEFFQLLHLIERIEQDAARVGHLGPARDEPIRLRPMLSLGFPIADIDSAEWREDAAAVGRLWVTTTFLGLYGSDSPLPTHRTETLLLNKDSQEEYDKDDRVREFLDIFHHRIYSMLYRVWIKYRYYATFRTDGSDPISQVVRGFLGIGTHDVDREIRGNPVRMFRYAGLLSQRPRSAAGLIGQLRDYFDGVEFDIDACVGRWVRIQPNDRNVLGERKCGLGTDFLLGEQIFDRSAKFRVEVGPVGFDDYTRFLPSGEAAADLADLVRFYLEDPFEFDVKVTLKGEEVPETPLGEQGMLGRLSWTSWLKSKPCENKSVIFNVPPRKAVEREAVPAA